MTPIFPKSISDVQYLYSTSGYLYPTSRYLYPTSWSYIRHSISIRHQISISDVDIQYPTSARARARARARAGISDIGYRYWTSDIDIELPIYILDIGYRFRKHWWHFVLNNSSYL